MIDCAVKLFEAEYDGETIVDLPRDIRRVIDFRFTPQLKTLPTDEFGFHKGHFVVKVEWNPD